MGTNGEVAELHEFAEKIGLKRHWFQGGRLPHYDLVKSKRELAVKHGAIEAADNQKYFRLCYPQFVRKRIHSIGVAWYYETSRRLKGGDQLGKRVRVQRTNDGGRVRDRYNLTPSSERRLLELAWNYEFGSFMMADLPRIFIHPYKEGDD